MDALVLHLWRSDFKTFCTEKAKIPEMVIKARRAFFCEENNFVYKFKLKSLEESFSNFRVK
jgi:hypothetical protein